MSDIRLAPLQVHHGIIIQPSGYHLGILGVFLLHENHRLAFLQGLGLFPADLLHQGKQAVKPLLCHILRHLIRKGSGWRPPTVWSRGR